MKTIYRILADSLFLIHAALVFIVFFGWAFPRIWHVYMGILIIVLVSDFIFGYCLFSRWEFTLRRKINPQLSYNYTWSSYYTYKFTNQRISDRTINTVGTIFIIGSIIINILIKLI